MSEFAQPGPLLVDVKGQSLTSEDCRLLVDPAVGGVILFTRNYVNPEQLEELTAAIRSVRPGLLIVADQEGGRVQRFREGFTPIPPMRTLGQNYQADPEGACAAASDLAWLLVAELRSRGVDMPLAPVADLDYGVSRAIGSRAFAESPDAVAALTGAFAKGLKEAGSVATVKHFPGHGRVITDSHIRLPVDARSLAELEYDWAPFAALIEQGINSVMMAHVRFSEVDALPASLSRRWVEDILRTRLGFTGCVFCDDLNMGGAAALGDYAERTRLALIAGCDFLPVCNNRDAAWIACRTVATGDVEDRGRERRQALLASVTESQASFTPGPDDPRWQVARATAARLLAPIETT